MPHSNVGLEIKTLLQTTQIKLSDDATAVFDRHLQYSAERFGIEKSLLGRMLDMYEPKVPFMKQPADFGAHHHQYSPVYEKFTDAQKEEFGELWTAWMRVSLVIKRMLN